MVALSGYILIWAGHAPVACLLEFIQPPDSTGTYVHRSAAVLQRLFFKTRSPACICSETIMINTVESYLFYIYYKCNSVKSLRSVIICSNPYLFLIYAVHFHNPMRIRLHMITYSQTIKSPLVLVSSKLLRIHWSETAVFTDAVSGHHTLWVSSHVDNNVRGFGVQTQASKQVPWRIFWWEMTRLDFPENGALIHMLTMTEKAPCVNGILKKLRCIRADMTITAQASQSERNAAFFVVAPLHVSDEIIQLL